MGITIRSGCSAVNRGDQRSDRQQLLPRRAPQRILTRFAKVSAMHPALLLAIYCSLSVVASLSGGWVPLVVRLTHRRMQIAISFVSGVMLGIGLLHLLPHSFAGPGVDRPHGGLGPGRLSVHVFSGTILPLSPSRRAGRNPLPDDATDSRARDHAAITTTITATTTLTGTTRSSVFPGAARRSD